MLIAIVPLLIVVISLTTIASNSLLKKAESSHLAYGEKVTDILDIKMRSIEEMSKIIVTDSKLNETVSKGAQDYENILKM